MSKRYDIEQIRTVLEPRALIGVSRAGLTNLLWLSRESGVLFPPNWRTARFGNLAAWRGVRHRALYVN